MPKWQLALAIVDELIAWGLPRRVVQADGGYGDITAFRVGLEERGLEYVVQVKATTSAQPADAAPVTAAYQGMGRPPVARYPDKPQSLRDLALGAGADQALTIGWREGDRGPLSSHFIALPVRPANGAQRDRDGQLPERWLLAQWPPAKAEPVKYWLSNLPPDTPLAALVRAAKLRWRVEHDYRELKQCLGLDHYEGRTYRGHCITTSPASPSPTRSSPARAYIATPAALRRRQPDQPLPSPARPPDRTGLLARTLPDLPAQAAAIT